MDTTTVAIVLGSNAFISLTTIVVTRWQVNSADKRLAKRLEQTTETDLKERRRQVRSEPLIRFRSEFARMATKIEALARAAIRQHTHVGNITEEDLKEELRRAIENWNAYLATEAWAQTCMTLDDQQLVDKGEKIRVDYTDSYYTNLNYRQAGAHLPTAMEVFERNRPRIAELQSLINDRLEKL